MDPLDAVFTLEDNFYRDGYALGQADGQRVGQAEGRAFGLTTGFEKLLGHSRLHGRALVWQHQINTRKQNSSASVQESSDKAQKPSGQSASTESSLTADDTPSRSLSDNAYQDAKRPKHNLSTPDLILPILPNAARLTRHVQALATLTEPPTHALVNEEEAVSELDDAIRRARAKAVIIGRILGEDILDSYSKIPQSTRSGTNDPSSNPSDSLAHEIKTSHSREEPNIEDIAIGRIRI